MDHKKSIREKKASASEDEDSYDELWFDDDDNDDDEDDVNDDDTERQTQSKPENHTNNRTIPKSQKIKPRYLNKAEKKADRRKRIWRIVTRKKQEIGMSSKQCRHRTVDEMINWLHKQGFYNIVTHLYEDLSFIDRGYENFVERICIDGEEEFDSLQRFPFNAKIEISYHVLKRARPPFIPREVKKKNVDYIVALLRNAGFINIHFIEIPDLVFGRLIKNGSVEKVTFNGRDDYRRKELFKVDAYIEIQYHTKKHGISK